MKILRFIILCICLFLCSIVNSQDISNSANWSIGSSSNIVGVNLINNSGGIITNSGKITISGTFNNTTGARFNNLCGGLITVTNASVNSSINSGTYTGAVSTGSISRFDNASDINNTGGIFSVSTGTSLSHNISGGTIGLLNKYVFTNSSQASTCSGLTKTFCDEVPAMPNCSGTLFNVDGLNTSNGVTYYSNITQTRNNLNMGNGATLLVCNDVLTLNGGNFNGGIIYIASGATLITDASTINLTIINYGTLNLTNNTTVNSNGKLINGLNAIMNINGNLFENSELINYGTVNISNTLTIQNSGSGACMGQNSKMNVSTISFGNNTNAIVSPDGKSCVGVSSTSVSGSGTTTITNTTDLIMCATTTLSTGGNGDISPATVDQNCASCDGALPIELLYFTGKNEKEYIFLEWATGSEKNNDFFSILKSYDGNSFNNIARIDGAGNSNYLRYYNYNDYDVRTGVNYYKLKQTDYDGSNIDSKIISINRNDLEFNVLIYPIPSLTPNVKISINKNIGNANIKCYNINGVTIFNVNIYCGGNVEYELGKYNLKSGTYFIKIETETCVYIKQIIINN